ncbi:MAG: FHA domain-containing protein [Anaerolineaceae bacterium]|nr:FHA domain-containing protein [Anaerolineaceae bacterium]
MGIRPKPKTLVITSEATDMDCIPKWGEVRFRQQNELILMAKGFSEKLVLRVNNSLILGRKGDADETDGPDVDLNVFEAYSRGVSKQHAVIEFADRLLTIRDLGSRNGTFLNMQAVVPNSHRVLRDNDILHLGNLELLIHFQGVVKS